MIWQAGVSVYVQYFSEMLGHMAAVHLRDHIIYSNEYTVAAARRNKHLRAPKELVTWTD